MRAAQLIRQSRVQLHDAHRATVYGATRSYDLDGFHCTCDASQKGLDPLVRPRRDVANSPAPWRSACSPTPRYPWIPPPSTNDWRSPHPVALGTLHLACAHDRGRAPDAGPAAGMVDVTQEELMADEDALEAQGDAMTEDEAAYIPNPQCPCGHPGAPCARTGDTAPARPSSAALARCPHAGAVMQAWAEQRAVVKRFIQTQLVDGTDYYTLQMGNAPRSPP